jgi:hypothetical protein
MKASADLKIQKNSSVILWQCFAIKTIPSIPAF